MKQKLRGKGGEAIRGLNGVMVQRKPAKRRELHGRTE